MTDQPALAGRDAGGGQIERGRVTLPSGADQHAIGSERRAAGEREHDITGLRDVAGGDALAPVKVDAACGHRRGQGAGNFAVEERHEDVAAIDEVRFHAERGEGAGVFAADHAATDDDEFLWHRLELEDFVGVVDAFILKRKFRRAQRRGASGDEDFLRPEPRFNAVVHDEQCVWVHEARVAGEAHVAQGETLLGATTLPGGHALLVPHEFSDGRLALEREVHAEEPPRSPAGKNQRRLAQGLARDRAGIDARAADVPRSISTVRAPIIAAASAPLMPAGPAPSTTTSNGSSVMVGNSRLHYPLRHQCAAAPATDTHIGQSSDGELYCDRRQQDSEHNL